MKISRYSLRAAVAAAVLAGTAAVPAAAFASDTGTPDTAASADVTLHGKAPADGAQPADPASPGTPDEPEATATPAAAKAKVVDIGGGMEAVIANGVCTLRTTGDGKAFATLHKGESYTKGIHVSFDGTNVNAKTQGEDDTGKIKPGPATTVTLGNGALATVQNVNGSYTAKIQVKNKEIATLSSTHPVVTFEGVRYTLNPKDGKVGIEYLNGKDHKKKQDEKRDGKQDEKHADKGAHRHGHPHEHHHSGYGHQQGPGHQEHHGHQQHAHHRAATVADRGERQHTAEHTKTPKGAVAAGEAERNGTHPALIAGGAAAAAALAGGGLLIARRNGSHQR